MATATDTAKQATAGEALRRPAVVVFGPTAAGKTGLAIELCRALGGEVVNADSRQVYRHMPIITAMPTAEEQAAVPHHLFEILEPTEPFSVADWLTRARAAAEGIWARGKTPFFVGGTGFYMDVLQHGISPIPTPPADQVAAIDARYDAEGPAILHAELRFLDPESAARLPAGDRQRVVRALAVAHATGTPLSAWQQLPKERAFTADFMPLLLLPARETLYRRIIARFGAMLEEGLMAEIENILAQGWPYELPALKSIGIPAYAAWKRGVLTLNEAHEKTLQHMRNYAKRQTTWARHQYQAEHTLAAASDVASALHWVKKRISAR